MKKVFFLAAVVLLAFPATAVSEITEVELYALPYKSLEGDLVPCSIKVRLKLYDGDASRSHAVLSNSKSNPHNCFRMTVPGNQRTYDTMGVGNGVTQFPKCAKAYFGQREDAQSGTHFIWILDHRSCEKANNKIIVTEIDPKGQPSTWFSREE